MKKIFTLLVLSSSFVFLLGSCGSSSDDYKYAGPGSYVELDLNHSSGTFAYKKGVSPESIDTDISGTFEKLDTGFIQMTVTASNKGAIELGTKAVGVEIPGLALLLQMDNGDVGPMIITGKCPKKGQEFTSNWIKLIPDQGANSSHNCSEESTDPNGRDWFGTFAYKASSSSQGTSSLGASFGLSAYERCKANPDMVNMPTTCENGIIEFDGDGADIRIYISQLKAAIVDVRSSNHEGNRDQVIVAFPVSKINKKSNLEGEYIGFKYSSNDGQWETVYGRVPSDGSKIDGYAYNSIDGGKNNTPDAVFTIDEIDSPSAGFMKVTYDTDKNAICQVTLNAGKRKKNILNCLSQEGEDGYFNFVVVSK